MIGKFEWDEAILEALFESAFGDSVILESFVDPKAAFFEKFFPLPENGETLMRLIAGFAVSLEQHGENVFVPKKVRYENEKDAAGARDAFHF